MALHSSRQGIFVCYGTCPGDWPGGLRPVVVGAGPSYRSAHTLAIHSWLDGRVGALGGHVVNGAASDGHLGGCSERLTCFDWEEDQGGYPVGNGLGPN